MGSPSDIYGRRFMYWEFWAALAAVAFDVVSFVVPVFALGFLVVLFHPHGWRWMGWLTDVLRRIQEGDRLEGE
ncbi:MAG: hypothetical protein ACE5IQ_12785 [Candidatus Methylomirabilales bacterium]